MTLALMLLANIVAAAGGVSGQVVNEQGAPLPDARVFMEPGIAGTLIEAPVDADGRFSFPETPVGPAGFVAHAPGYAFGGKHLNISVGESHPDLRIVLKRPDSVSGSVKNSSGDRVEGARITRLALLDDKVGVPLAKLRAFGFDEPASDKRGQFTVPNLPAGASVALKIGHPDYAQEGVENVAVGGKADVTLYRGALIDGAVIQTAGQAPVSQAAVIIRNAQPPYDTATVQTDTFGSFSLRLKPGVYLAQALGAGQSSPGWQELVVTGETNIVNCRLELVGTGLIRGKLMDAASGKPVEGARISLETNGNLAAVERTGPSGEFRFVAGQGQNIVTYAATPGYLPPETRSIALDLKSGETFDLPDMWLAPVPPFTLEVLDAEMKPVPNARVQLLRPRQFGWQTADMSGKLQIKLSNLSSEGNVVGFAEAPGRGEAALFQLERGQSGAARVQTLPLTRLTGKVEGSRGKALAGAVIGGIFPGEAVDSSLLLWRVVANKQGAFAWPVLTPGVPQVCVARAANNKTGASQLLNAAQGAAVLDAGEIRVEQGEPAASAAGERLDWSKGGLLCGAALPDAETSRHKIVFYVSPAQLAYVLETLEKDKALFSDRGWALVVICTGAVNCPVAAFPVYQGQAPSAAQTFILAPDDTVLFETFDVPSIALLDAMQQ